LIDILRTNCAPSWFYLQDYTEMQVQQNIKKEWNAKNHDTVSILISMKYEEWKRTRGTDIEETTGNFRLT
jgi:hypothetical protein